MWTAFYTPISASDWRIHVKGELPSFGGQTFSLQKQGSPTDNPGVLVLNKVAVPAKGRLHNDLAMETTVSYEETVSGIAYSKVLVLPDEITIPVEQLNNAASQ